MTHNVKRYDLLIEKAKSRNSKAQMKLYKLYSHAMYNTALRILHVPEEAEEAMHDGFLKAFEQITTFSKSVSFGSWLKKIVINSTIDYLRKHKKEVLIFEQTDFQETEIDIEQNHDWFESHIRNSEKIKKLTEVINLLPEGYRLIFNLHMIEGFDYEEISEILKISQSSARSQFARAKAQIKIKLGIELNNKNTKKLNDETTH